LNWQLRRVRKTGGIRTGKPEKREKPPFRVHNRIDKKIGSKGSKNTTGRPTPGEAKQGKKKVGKEEAQKKGVMKGRPALRGKDRNALKPKTSADAGQGRDRD